MLKGAIKEEVKPPTEEQIQILDLMRGDDNLMINSLAGTGKTDMIQRIEREIKIKPMLYLVFQKSNQQEAEEKMLSTTTVRTLNGCGHRIWMAKCGGNLSLNGKKCGDLLRNLIDETPNNLRSEIWDVYWDVLKGVELAKALGYVPDGKFSGARRLIDREGFVASNCFEEPPDELVLDLIDAVLIASIKAAFAGAIDFNDQVYMPAVFGGPYPKFPLVAVDEYQDLNPVNHAMLDQLVKYRVVGVGDPWQNIYGFRGAKQGGMEEAKAKFQMAEANLTVSFRCPEQIVRNAWWRVPQYKWFKTGGHVERLEYLEFRDIPEGAAIICRNNAPLFRLGMQLLSRGRSVTIAGSDIGPRVTGIMRKLGPEDTSRATLINAIEAWRSERLAKESTTANDTADCMRVFAEHGKDLAQAIAYAEHLFKQKGELKLLTGHKSKGLEFGTVYLLDTFLLREDEQDLNLKYVMQTRAAEAVYEIESRNIKWS